MNTHAQPATANAVHEDVIIDLAALYFAGEASAASRTLVEGYFAQHPDMAARLRASQSGAAAMPGVPPGAAGSGHAALLRLRKLLRLRGVLMGLAIACTLAPLSFTFGEGHSWSMLRDAPATAMAYGVAAVVTWVAYAIVVRQTRTP